LRLEVTDSLGLTFCCRIVARRLRILGRAACSRPCSKDLHHHLWMFYSTRSSETRKLTRVYPASRNFSILDAIRWSTAMPPHFLPSNVRVSLIHSSSHPLFLCGGSLVSSSEGFKTSRGFQQRLTVFLTSHQGVTKTGQRCNHVTSSSVGPRGVFSWMQPVLPTRSKSVPKNCFVFLLQQNSYFYVTCLLLLQTQILDVVHGLIFPKFRVQSRNGNLTFAKPTPGPGST